MIVCTNEKEKNEKLNDKQILLKNVMSFRKYALFYLSLPSLRLWKQFILM